MELDVPHRDGLDSLGGFDYAWLLTWLHHLDGPAGLPPLRQVPFLLRRQQRRLGIFATRGPRRINPIGLSLVRIFGFTSAGIDFAGVDLVDGTPVIDVKPYVSRFDRPPGDPRCGWFDQVTISENVTPAQLGKPDCPDEPETGRDDHLWREDAPVSRGRQGLIRGIRPGQATRARSRPPSLARPARRRARRSRRTGHPGTGLPATDNSRPLRLTIRGTGLRWVWRLADEGWQPSPARDWRCVGCTAVQRARRPRSPEACATGRPCT